jgi:hypothetical protein
MEKLHRIIYIYNKRKNIKETLNENVQIHHILCRLQTTNRRTIPAQANGVGCKQALYVTKQLKLSQDSSHS